MCCVLHPAKYSIIQILPTGCFECRIMCVHDGEIEHLLWIEVGYIYVYIYILGWGNNVSNVSCMYVRIA
jgi:hypothetical protein